MIDTHCHLLPNIDDGPRSEAETYEMCRLAQDDGITTIVATPHSFDGQFLTKPETVQTLTGKLSLHLKSTGIHVEIMPGMEVRVGADLLQHLDRDEILPLNNGKDLLVEFHNSDLPAGCEHFFQKLLESGYKAVIAHPERNLAIQSSPEFVYKLLGLFAPWEILVQVFRQSYPQRSCWLNMATVPVRDVLRRSGCNARSHTLRWWMYEPLVARHY